MRQTLIQITIFIIIASSGAFVYAQTEISPPSVEIITPSENDRFANEVVDFKVAVKNFTFVDFKNNAAPFPGNPNAGHVHLWIDPPAIGATKEAVYEVRSPDVQNLDALERGRYKLTAELVDNMHRPYEPRVFEAVSIRVDERTLSGKYTITKRESTENVGRAPRRLTGLFIALGVVFIILVAVFIYRDRLKKHKFVIAIKRKYDKSSITNRLRKNKLTNSIRKMYDKLRRKK